MADRRKRPLVRLGAAVAAALALNGVLVFAFPQERTALLAAWDDARKRDTPGFALRTYVDEAGRPHKYAVFVPFARPPGGRPPVILYLNGLGQNGDDGVSPLGNGLAPAVWDRRSDFPFVVVFAQCHREDRWDADTPSGRRALEILDKTVAECDADPDRVVVTGISAGGSGGWRLAAAHPGRFAAVVPVSATVPGDAAEAVAAARLPVWGFCVRGDAEGLVASNEDAHRSVLRLGGTSLLTTLDGTRGGIIDRHDAWDFAFRDDGLRGWLLAQSARTRPAPEPPLVPFEDGTPRAGTWEARGDELVGRAASLGDDAEYLLGTADGDWKLHVEFRTPAGGGWELAFRGAGESPTAEARLAVATSDAGGGGLSDGAGRPLGFAAPAAQRSIATGEGDWNDLRVDVSAGRVAASLNGRPLVDAPGPAPEGGVTVSLRIPAGQQAPVAWRHLRFSKTGKLRGPGEADGGRRT